MIHRLPLIVPPPHRRPRFALSDGGAGPEPLFHETFDGGGLSAPFWAGTNNSGGASIEVVTDQAWNGTHSMRFRFPGTGEDSSAEYRIHFPEAVTEIWLQFMLRVPDNYVHKAVAPANNKFMTLWAENYSTANEAQFYLSFERQANGNTRCDILAVHGDDPRYPTDAQFFGPDFITPADRGNWIQTRVHARIAVDGGVDVWRNGVPWVQTGPYNMTRAATGGAWDYFQNGYLMGWSNSGYDAQTDFYWDDIIWYDQDPGWEW